MPLYMDVHRFPNGITREECEMAHLQDLKVQEKYGVKYLKYWMNEDAGTVFCLIEAPNKKACHAVHDEAHGEVAKDIIEVDGDSYLLMMGECQTDSMGNAVISNGQFDSAVRTFLFTDIVSSTSITQRMGDQGSFIIVKRHNEIVRNALQENGGREVKHTGDGIMAAFLSASKAALCAQQIQVSLERFREKYENVPLHVRIGLNAGEPVTEGDDFFGVAVQAAKRICDHAKSGQILASNVLHDLCLGKSIRFKQIGEIELKGIELPQVLYEVDWKG